MLLGILFIAIGRLAPGGRLPGGVVITRGPVSCLFPLALSLLLSLLLMLVPNRWMRR